MLTREEFERLYNEADKETQEQIKQILKEEQEDKEE